MSGNNSGARVDRLDPVEYKLGDYLEKTSHLSAIVEGIADEYGDDGVDMLVMLCLKHLADRRGSTTAGAAHLLSLLPAAMLAIEKAGELL